MAHAKLEHLKKITTLLDEIRKVDSLKEKSLGCFYFKNKGVLHFHMNKDQRFFAHVFDGKNWIEIDISLTASVKKQKETSKSILQILVR